MTQRYTDTDRVIALAGVFQAARLATEIARRGKVDTQAFTASREALFSFSPDSVADVFGGESGVALGLRTLYMQIGEPQQRDLELSRYVVSILHLADRLVRQAAAQSALADDLSALTRRRESFDLGDSVLHEQLGRIYQERISPLGPRIMIRGEPLHLQNPDNAARIRAALLGGVRAGVLWRQAGGRKWQLLFKRHTIARLTRELIDRFMQ